MHECCLSLRAAREGFTLLELLIVCLLISISLAISIPSLRHSIVADELAAGSRKVISLVQSARSTAIREHVPYIIHLDSAAQKLWYELEERAAEETTTPPASSITLEHGVRVQKIQQATAGNDHDPQKEGLWISKEGYMDKTSIQLADKNNNTLNLLISPFLQRIKIVEEPVDFQ